MALEPGVNDRPISPADLPLDDIPATEPVPEHVAAALARRRLDLFVGDRRATVDELCDALRHTHDLELPEGFSTRLPGRRAVASRDDDPTGAEPGAVGSAYRPPWVPQVYRPRLAALPRAQDLPAADGRFVKPLRPERVYGREDRHPHLPLGYPWHCIGQLTVYGPSGAPKRGTATLIGRSNIVTAAHMVPTEWGTSWSANFVAAASSMVGALRWLGFRALGASSWVTEYHGFHAGLAAGNDVMVMHLSDPLGDALGWLGFRAYTMWLNTLPMWTHVGYPSKFGGDDPYVQEQISVAGTAGAPNDCLELQHYGDAGQGDSGGPLFSWFDDGPYVAGVMSGNSWKHGGFLGIGNHDYNVDAGVNGFARQCWFGRNNWG